MKIGQVMEKNDLKSSYGTHFQDFAKKSTFEGQILHFLPFWPSKVDFLAKINPFSFNISKNLWYLPVFVTFYGLVCESI